MLGEFLNEQARKIRGKIAKLDYHYKQTEEKLHLPP